LFPLGGKLEFLNDLELCRQEEANLRVAIEHDAEALRTVFGSGDDRA
jgi:hypothetical protein